MDLTIEFYHWKFFNRILFLSRNETRHVFQLQIIFNTHEGKSSISLMEKDFYPRMKNIDSNPLLSTLWRIIRLHYEKSKNSFSLPSIFKSIPKNCQGSHERIFCIQFPRLASLFFFHVTFVSLSLSILPNRIIPSSRERDGVTPRTVSRKFRAKHFGDT